jgi:hypothetical protein
MDRSFEGQAQTVVYPGDEVAVRRCDVDHARFEVVAVARFLDVESGVPSEQLSQDARVVPVQMLDHHDGGWKSEWKIAEDLSERAQASSR